MTLANKVAQFISDSDTAHQIIHGDATTVVTTEGGDVRSLAKFIADSQLSIDAQAAILSEQLASPSGATLVKANIYQTQNDVNLEWATVKRFGAVGDWNGTTGTDDTAAIQAAIDYCSANKIRLRVTGGSYKLTGQLTTKSNLHLEFDNDAWFIPTAWSATGSIITNVGASPVQTNIVIDNPQMDGQHLPTDAASNDNAIGFANGASYVRVQGGHIKNFQFSWSGSGAGGKAVNFESGVTNSMALNISAENCGIAVFVQGHSGADNQSSVIIVNNVIAENCGAVVVVMGINSLADPDGAAADQIVLVDGVTFHNCGHAPNRPVTSDFQKSGAIVIGEGQNVNITNVQGYNDTAYTATWPTGGTTVGSGLSGPIGAVIWGWGRNITIGNVEYHGDCDDLIRINRARALGEDAAPTAQPQNVSRFDVDGLRHYGTCQTVLALDSNVAARVAATELSGVIRNVVSDVLTSGIVSSTLSGYSGIFIEAMDGATNKSISGTASSVFLSMNAFSSTRGQKNLINSTEYASLSTSDRFFGRSLTLADDTATSITPATASGVLVIASDTSLLRALVAFRVGATGAQIANMGSAVSNFAVTTGALTGITGADVTFTVSAHSDGKLYFENRRGGNVVFTATLLG